jgi:hypothetical protein
LAAASFAVAEIAEAQGEATELSGDFAEAIAAAPFNAVLKVALGDFAGVSCEDADGLLDRDYGGKSDDDRSCCEDPCGCGETSSDERAVRNDYQSDNKTGQNRATEDQTLGQVEHEPASTPGYKTCSMRAAQTRLALARIAKGLSPEQLCWRGAE